MMKPKPLHFRCWAERRSNGRWYAHCIDLTLDGEGDTYLQAKENLDGAILSYLKTILSEGLEHGLLRRPSPLSFRLRYHEIWLRLFLRSIFSKRPNGLRTDHVDVPGGLTPAHA